MTTTEKWNSIVSNVKSMWSATEKDVQNLWENIFADTDFFGYSRFSNEIDSQRNITIGSYERTIPDIVIRDSANNKDLFVVELKQHNLPFDTKYKGQLFSYMRLLRLNVGILVCNKIYLYVLDNTDNEISMEIPFVINSVDGTEFVELFRKGNFEAIKVKDFISSHKEKQKRIFQIQQEIKSLTLNDLLIEHFSKNYDVCEINEAISAIKLSSNLVLPDFTTATESTISNETWFESKNSTKVVHNHKINEDFTVTSAKGIYRGKSGFKAINSSQQNVGIIFMTDDKRGPAYGHCELCSFPNFQPKYGEWHRIKSHGKRIKWDDLYNYLQTHEKITIHID